MGNYIKTGEPPGNKPGYVNYPMNKPELTDLELEQLAFRFEIWLKEQEKVPVLAGFCAKENISKQSLSKWAKRNERLGEAVQRAHNIRENILVNGGLHEDSGIRPGFAIFLLSSTTNYTPKKPKEDGKQKAAATTLSNLTSSMARDD